MEESLFKRFFSNLRTYLNSIFRKEPESITQPSNIYVGDEGETITLAQNVGEGYYQWFRNGKPISQPSLNKTIFKIKRLTLEEVGIYTIEVTDSSTQGKLAAKPMHVYQRGYDLAGEPIIEDQLMFTINENVTEKEEGRFRALIKGTYKGQMIKACNCGVKLELWRFPEDVDIYRPDLNPNGKLEDDEGEIGIDGGFNRVITLPKITSSSREIRPFRRGRPDREPTNVYIIDSGIDIHHPVLAPYFANIAPNCLGGSGLGTNFIPPIPNDDIQDLNGHGTAVAGLVIKDVPTKYNIRLKSMKVFDESGNGILFDLVCAIHHSINEGADMINFSGSYKGFKSRILSEAILRAETAGILFFTSAGNDSNDIDTTDYWPACFTNKNVVTVTALNKKNQVLPEVNFGRRHVDIATLGVDLETTMIGGNMCTFNLTSASTPVITRTAALIKADNPSLTWFQIREKVFNLCVQDSSLNHQIEDGKRLETGTLFASAIIAAETSENA